MTDLKERAAYLKGLFEGIDLDQETKVRPLWEEMLKFCGDVADTLHDVQKDNDELSEYMEAVDEDLSVLEKFFYENESEEETENLFSNDNGDTVIELECPKCQEEICFTDEPGDYEVICPECGETVWTHSVEIEPVSKDVI